MRVSTQLIADPVFERLYPNVGDDENRVKEDYPDDYPRFHQEMLEIKTDRESALMVCILAAADFMDRKDQGAFYVKDFVDNATRGISKSIGWLGRYGRTEIYAYVMKGMTERRRQNPEANSFIDLLIKNMLQNEVNLQVRKDAWAASGIGNKKSQTLTLVDVLRKRGEAE